MTHLEFESHLTPQSKHGNSKIRFRQAVSTYLYYCISRTSLHQCAVCNVF